MNAFSDLDIGVMLVDGLESGFGKILMVNQILLKVLGYTIGEVKNKRIEIL